MSRVEVEHGRRYYCEVVGSSEPLAGTFMIAGTDIRASLVRFDRFLRHETEGALRVRTEGNWFASMFDLIPSGWSQRGGGESRTYVQDTSSNIALIGWDIWTDDDLVNRLIFRIPGLDPLFNISPHLNSVIDSNMARLPDLTAFKVEAGGVSVKAWLAPSGNLTSERPRDVTPWMVVEFSRGVLLADIRQMVHQILRFFSTVAGKHLHAADLVVSRHTEAEITRRAETREPTSEHRVFRYEDGSDFLLDQIEPYSALVSLWAPDDRRALEASLVAWIERAEVWEPAAAMLNDTLSKQGVMSVSRLLSASRCLEEIPGASPVNTITKDHAKALSKLVGRGAEKLGYGAVAGRFKNAISKIALETNRERLARLVSDVRSAFGPEVVDDHIVDWVAEGLSMRGRAAHGARTALDDEYEVFARAVEAIECLNVLLMLKDLPLGDEHIARASRHPLVQQYRSCTLPGPPTAFRAGLLRVVSERTTSE